MPLFSEAFVTEGDKCANALAIFGFWRRGRVGRDLNPNVLGKNLCAHDVLYMGLQMVNLMRPKGIFWS